VNEIERVRKAQQAASREQVAAALGVGPEPGFHADVRNTGDVSVYLKEVVLDWSSGPRQTMRTGLLIATPLPAADGSRPGRYIVLGHKNHDLPPGHEVRYVLPRFPASVVAEMAAGPTTSLALRVFSYLGEVHCVGGDELQPSLAALARLWQAQEEAGDLPSRAGRLWAFPLPAKKK
jgi:hypothetical protein